jgi:hypothetical protein
MAESFTYPCFFRPVDTDSVTYCSEAKGILVNDFDIQYHKLNKVSLIGKLAFDSAIFGARFTDCGNRMG